MIHPSVKIHPTARINCDDITIGAGGVIGPNCVIEGTRVVIGRDLWMDDGALIGGGSCHDPCAYLKAGHYLHMGRHSQINIARGVDIGNECGIGIQTQIFTHGAYLNELEGFPVQFASVSIGDRVWLPNAWVNPGVTIGSDVVVAARSLVNRDIPSGSLAGGSPAKVIKENEYPKLMKPEVRAELLSKICAEALAIDSTPIKQTNLVLEIDEAVFNLHDYTIQGKVSKASENLRNQLRRHGVRFYCSPDPAAITYRAWK